MYILEPIVLEIGSNKFKVDTDFRSVINLIYSEDTNVFDLVDARYWMALEYYVKPDLQPLMINMHAMQINSGLFLKDEYPPVDDIDEIDDTPQTKTIHYLKDYSMIIASFQHYYNIDLLNTDFMDFRQFLILMHNIKGTTLSDIIRIREMELPTGANNVEHREEVIKLKARYAIDEPVEKNHEVKDWLAIAQGIKHNIKE